MNHQSAHQHLTLDVYRQIHHSNHIHTTAHWSSPHFSYGEIWTKWLHQINWFDLLQQLDYLCTSVSSHHSDGLRRLLGVPSAFDAPLTQNQQRGLQPMGTTAVQHPHIMSRKWGNVPTAAFIQRRNQTCCSDWILRVKKGSVREDFMGTSAYWSLCSQHFLLTAAPASDLWVVPWDQQKRTGCCIYFLRCLRYPREPIRTASSPSLWVIIHISWQGTKTCN